MHGNTTLQLTHTHTQTTSTYEPKDTTLCTKTLIRIQTMAQAQNQRQVQILPDLATTGSLVVRGVKYVAKKNPIMTGSYLLGLVVLLMAGSGTKLTYDQAMEYNRIMSSIDVEAEYSASNDYALAKQRYDRSKGWFTCNDECQFYKKRASEAKVILDRIRKEGYNRMSDAKAVAGLFSEVGVGETKDAFWEYFTNGQRFAKRQSMWDMLFMGMRSMSRDESFLEYAMKILFQVLINFSIGLIMALVFFVFGLWSIVQSYQASPLTAVLFFVLALCAGFAFVSTYLLAMYGAAGGAVYGVAKLAEGQLRLEQQRGGNRRQRNVGYRPHYQ